MESIKTNISSPPIFNLIGVPHEHKLTIPERFIGLDVHKHYLIALGVDAALNVILPIQRVEFSRLEAWMKKKLNQQDTVALEMTTKPWQLYDERSPLLYNSCQSFCQLAKVVLGMLLFFRSLGPPSYLFFFSPLHYYGSLYYSLHTRYKLIPFSMEDDLAIFYW